MTDRRKKASKKNLSAEDIDLLLARLEAAEQTIEAMSEGLALHEIVVNDSGTPIDYIITEVNPAFARITGLNANMIVGKRASAAYASGDAPYLDIYSRVAFTGKPTSFETYFPPMNKYFSISVFSPGKNKFGTVFRDITDLKRAEKVIRENEEKYRVALENSPITVARLDCDLRYTWVFNTQYGIQPKEVIGKRADEIITPEDAAETMALQREAIESGLPIRRVIYGKTNHVAWIHDATAVPFRNDRGDIAGLTFATFDITERKQAEETLRHAKEEADTLRLHLEAVMAALPVGVAITDVHGGNIRSNIAFEEIWGGGCPTTRCIDDYAAYKAWWPDTGKMVLPEEWASAIAVREGRTIVGQIMEIQRFDGTRGYVINSAAPVRNAAGIITGSAVAIEDITKLRSVEKSLRESEERFRLALRNAPVTVATQDKDLRFTWAYNQRTIDPEQIFGKTDTDIFAPEDAMRLMSLKRMVIKTGHEAKEQGWITSNGKRVFLDIFIRPLHNDAGEVTGIGIATVDLTPMKLSEDALRESEERFRTIAETLPVLVCITRSEDSIVLFTNEYNNRAFGLRSEEVIGSRGPDYYCDPADRIKMIDLFRKQGFVHNHQLKVKKGDGTPFWILTSVRPIVYHGQPAMIGASIDITELKQVEKALRDSEERYRLLFHQAAVGIKRIDRYGRLLEVNEKLCEILGYRRDELLHLSLDDITHPEDMPIEKQKLQKLFSQELMNFNFEKRCLKKDGTVIWVRVTCSRPSDSQKSDDWCITVIEDITERNMREQELRQVNHTLKAMSDSSQAMIRARDESSLMNEVCRIIIEDCGFDMVWIGLAENDEQKSVRVAAHAGFEDGYTDTLRITWADTERGRGPTGTAIRTGKVTMCRNMRTDPAFAPWREEAEKRGYASSIVLPLITEGKPFGALNIYARDPDPFSESAIKLLLELADDLALGITTIRNRIAREQAEEAARMASDELTRINKELERSNNDLEQFAYIASHDLQEPLRAVAGFMGILNKLYGNKLDADGRDCIIQAIEGAERMQVLIRDLLTYSRVGTRGGEFVRMEMKTAFDAAISNLRFAIDESHAQVSADPLPAVQADLTQMTQLFQNLIANAIKFRSASTPEIRVLARKDSDGWIFGVRDNGIGIDPRYFNKIFMIFQRLHSRSEYKGTGIGLALCKKIVERHGGSMWVESAPGAGSVFYFSIPFRREQE